MTPQRLTRAFLCMAMAALLAGPASACEPILPLVLMFTGGNYLMPGAVLLFAGVLIKALAFAGLERSIKPGNAIGAMFLGNIVSSIVGIMISFGMLIPVLMLFQLPIVYALTYVPAQRLKQFRPNSFLGKRHSPGAIAGFILVAYVASFILFLWGQGVLFNFKLERPATYTTLALYWGAKFACVFVAVGISILLTTLWEEWIVAKVSGTPEKPEFYSTVLRANLITYGFIMGAAALAMLPKRHWENGFLAMLRAIGFDSGVDI